MSPDCIGFGLDVAGVGANFLPPGFNALAGLSLDAAGAGLDAGTRDNIGLGIDVLTFHGGMGALAYDAVNNTQLGVGVDIATAGISFARCVT